MENNYLMYFNELNSDEVFDLDGGGFWGKVAGAFTALAGAGAIVEGAKAGAAAGTFVGGPAGTIIGGVAGVGVLSMIFF